jgi:hypothetical protein
MKHETLDDEWAMVHEQSVLANIAAPTEEERAKTVRCLAAHAASSQELAEWLDMLGLSAGEGRFPC